MALSEFEVIVGGLTSIPVLAGIFFLIEKTYASKNYLRKPVKVPAASKPPASNKKDGAAVQPSAAKTASAKLKTSVSVEKSSAPTTISTSTKAKPLEPKVLTSLGKDSDNSSESSSEGKESDMPKNVVPKEDNDWLVKLFYW